jgi:uncharacterized protein YbjQ (UPF0145 family)
MALPIFTIQTFNQTTLQPVGAVFAQRVESVSVAKSSFAGFSSPNTGRSTAMEKKMNDLTKALISEINSQAKATYPNAVALVDLNIQFSNIGKNGENILLAGQASATAIVKRKAPVAAPQPQPQPQPVAVPQVGPSQPIGPVVMSQPMAMVPSQPMDMSMAMAPPVPSQPMAVPESQPLAMAAPMAMAPPVPGPTQGGRRNRRKTVNKRNYKRSRKNRR